MSLSHAVPLTPPTRDDGATSPYEGGGISMLSVAVKRNRV